MAHACPQSCPTKQLLLGCPEGVLGQMDDWLVGWLDQRRSYNNKCTVVNDLVARRDDLFELFNSLAQVITAPPPPQRPNRSYQFFVGHHERPTAVATCAPCIIIIAHSCSVDIYSISVTPFTSQLNSATVHLTYPHSILNSTRLFSPLPPIAVFKCHFHANCVPHHICMQII